MVPCGGDQVRDVESDRWVNVHMFWRAEGAETGQEVVREDGDGVGRLR